MTTAELDEAAVWQWWCRQSAAQAFDPEITDPAVIGRLVTLAFAGAEGRAEGGGGRARAS